ncbi:hypothetical protein AB0M35_18045 [Micromonospora sp. NPDC051196]|uniref:hypothetical protein n=1 Tax=Micromonospora sp. NPDC051196 TaxID=3155281 RepID=UPI00341AB03F
MRVDGVWGVLRALSRVPSEADRQLQATGYRLAAALSGRVAGAARSDSRQSALMAGTVRAVGGEIVAGGSARVGRRGTPAYKILFGSEYGARVLPQFRPHRGSGSYWMWAEILRSKAEIDRESADGAERVVRAIDRGV